MGDNPVIETTFGLIFLAPHLIGPALVVALLIVAAPILRRRLLVSRERGIAALLLVVLSLFRAFPLIGWYQDLGAYGIVLMIARLSSSVATLIADKSRGWPVLFDITVLEIMRCRCSAP